MRNAPVSAIIYELLCDMYYMMDKERNENQWFCDENGILCEAFDNGYTSKWEWSTDLLTIAGAAKPLYPPRPPDDRSSQRSTPFYTPLMTLEECLRTDFSAFETFGNYCYAMFTFQQFVDEPYFHRDNYSPLFVENFAEKDDIFLVEPTKNGFSFVDWLPERFEEKVMAYWVAHSNRFEAKI